MVACGGPNVPDSTTTPPGSFKEAFSQLEARGELPVLDRTDTIAGIDANQNGVRDDIEAFINSLPDTPVQKKTTVQPATRAQQFHACRPE